MELPPLKGLLRACWRVQRGEEEAASGWNEGAVSGGGPPGHSCSYEGRPCGYVFRRGDIAWNCQTCQTDATCVLCDNCYRESDHVGYEVFFHRTTPGGCCDCGDLEAWNVDGMCGRHRPPSSGGGEAAGPMDGGGDDDDVETSAGWAADDDLEAVRAAHRARLEHERIVDGSTLRNAVAGQSLDGANWHPFPPRLAAALSVVVGSAIQSILTASEGSAIGADVTQWRLRWADEICKLWNGVSEDEEYYGHGVAMLAEGRSMDGGAATAR